MTTQSSWRDSPDQTGYAGVIGDIVRSKSHSDRRRLQLALRAALDGVNKQITSLQPLRETIGDEFQGLYATLPSALHAALLVRLHLIGTADVRFGIGWGHLVVYEPSQAPYAQDGPVWWASRESIEKVRAAAAQRESPRGLRTYFSLWSHDGPTEAGPDHDYDQLSLSMVEKGLPKPQRLPPVSIALINSYLICRDELVGQMDDRDARLCIALFLGEPQADIAKREGISQSAIAQRFSRNGAYALLNATQALSELDSWPL